MDKAEKLFALNDGIKKSVHETRQKDIGFYMCMYPEYASLYRAAQAKLLAIGNQAWGAAESMTSMRKDIDTNEFSQLSDIITDYEKVIDISDRVFEYIDATIDVYQQKLKHKRDGSSFSSSPMIAEISQANGGNLQVIHAQNIIRPQLKFKDKIDNSVSAPFKPKISNKPNSLRELDTGHVNPYIYELDCYYSNIMDYISESLELEDMPVPHQVSIGDVVWIDTKEQLLELSALLTKEGIFGVDLEHHAYRSYQGFTCLMQISTSTTDYLIDALALRDALSCLNSSMTDPKIIKVFHGAEQDILWLQKDFGIYVVGLFDTFLASKAIGGMPSHSLSYLLLHYLQKSVDKKYQLADWRIRPLPKEMIIYASEDTHYLIYLYNRMVNDLLNDKDQDNIYTKIVQVFEQGCSLCSRSYEKPKYDPDNSWRDTFYKHPRPFHTSQLNVFKAIHQWRDHVAREQDESTRYVLPNHMLFQIAQEMPTQSSSVLNCCHPIPPLVRQHANDIAIMVERVKKDPSDPFSTSSSTKDKSTEQEPIVAPPVVSKQKSETDVIPVQSADIRPGTGQGMPNSRLFRHLHSTNNLGESRSNNMRDFYQTLQSQVPLTPISIAVGQTNSLSAPEKPETKEIVQEREEAGILDKIIHNVKSKRPRPAAVERPALDNTEDVDYSKIDLPHTPSASKPFKQRRFDPFESNESNRKESTFKSSYKPAAPEKRIQNVHGNRNVSFKPR
jgi:ribonuclease D